MPSWVMTIVYSGLLSAFSLSQLPHCFQLSAFSSQLSALSFQLEAISFFTRGKDAAESGLNWRLKGEG